MSSNEIYDLISRIKSASLAYESGKPVLTDDQYDTLIEELKSLSPDHTLLSKTAAGADVTGKVKKPHKYGHIGSLEKTKDIKVFDKFTNPVIMKKYDGCSITIEYKDGVLTEALTRNNGEVGVDVTDHIKKIVPNIVHYLGNLCIRGELLVKRDIFANKYQDKYANERNFVSGIINRIVAGKELLDLEVVFYKVIYHSESSFTTKKSELLFLEDMDLNTGDYFNYYKKEELTYNDLFKWAKTDSKYLTDGIVIYDEDTTVTPIAFKFESQEVDVVVKEIEWNTGVAGNIIPVITFEKVKLDGANVGRASGGSAGLVVKNSIDAGATIRIHRSNEVIPHFLKTILPAEKVFLPANCPLCNSKPEMIGEHLKCLNKECYGKTFNTLLKLCEICGVPDGLAATSIEKWFSEFPYQGDFSNIESIHDFYIIWRQVVKSVNTVGRHKILLDKFGNHLGELLNKLETNIREKLTTGIPYNEFWYLLNLPALGNEHSKRMGSIDPANLTLSYDDLIRVKNTKVNTIVLDAITNNIDHINRVAKYFKLTPPEESKPTLFNVAVTGAVKIPRPKWIKLLESHGIKVTGINKDTKYFITNEVSNSSKSQAAIKLGIKPISETEFYEILDKEYQIVLAL